VTLLFHEKFSWGNFLTRTDPANPTIKSAQQEPHGGLGMRDNKVEGFGLSGRRGGKIL
jgi:hypothetical protein